LVAGGGFQEVDFSVWKHVNPNCEDSMMKQTTNNILRVKGAMKNWVVGHEKKL
jgi:hypothetical protein